MPIESSCHALSDSDGQPPLTSVRCDGKANCFMPPPRYTDAGLWSVAVEFSLPLIIGAGILSFLSPCVLPLVPPYLT